MTIEKLLAGVDLGPDTGKVLAYASFFAKGLGSSLHVLHVIDFLVTPPAYMDRYMEEERKKAEEEFLVWKKRLGESGIMPVMEVVVGRLHESFLSEVEKLDAKMLVLGFRSHALRRSSSEKLIKGLGMPMLVVRGEKAGTAGIGSVNIGKILCPVDFSEVSAKALKVASQIGRIFSSDLQVMHVLTDNIIKKKVPPGKDLEKVTKELLKQAGDNLADLLAGSGIGKEGTIEEGEPHDEILSAAREKDADLIVMGARGRSFMGGILIGSVTDAVLKSSPCPVLVIH
jgi:nucleotide-binding universal stress UspA family protein